RSGPSSSASSAAWSLVCKNNPEGLIEVAKTLLVQDAYWMKHAYPRQVQVVEYLGQHVPETAAMAHVLKTLASPDKDALLLNVLQTRLESKVDSPAELQAIVLGLLVRLVTNSVCWTLSHQRSWTHLFRLLDPDAYQCVDKLMTVQARAAHFVGAPFLSHKSSPCS